MDVLKLLVVLGFGVDVAVVAATDLPEVKSPAPIGHTAENRRPQFLPASEDLLGKRHLQAVQEY